MSENPVLIWLRQDLRLDDHPALHAAVETGRPVALLYIFDEANAGPHGIGSAQKWWLHHSLTRLSESICAIGGRLILRRGDAREVAPEVARALGATEVFWTRRYAAAQIECDRRIKSALEGAEVTVNTFNGSVLNEPWEIKTKSDTFYRVFTPYWRQVWASDKIRMPKDAITAISSPETNVHSDDLDSWGLLPTNPNWADAFPNRWTPGEAGAAARWEHFLAGPAATYVDDRNRPDKDGTSGLSPHLHFGEVSPVRLWHEMQAAIASGDVPADQGKVFLSEITWREFSHQLTYHHPTMTHQPLMEKFAQFQWNDDPEALRAWQKGQTGYPIVDAGMRELWQTGWMHNRVRMIVGSFLVKDLLLDWRHGMDWFWDTLLDADPANNTASWQWIAGCGADAAPFFRIFNPTTQGQKFDPNGDYVRRFVPELAALPTKYIHDPAGAPPDVRNKAGVALGKTYPAPIVDHSDARKEALARYQAIK